MSQDLGKFLTSKRKERGLRREDVAAAAFIGYEYYGRIERGTAVPLVPVLQALIEALALEPGEGEYVLSFASRRPRPPIIRFQEAPESVLRVIQLQKAFPAYVVDRRLDIVHWNRATSEIYGVNLDEISPDERNVAWLVFKDPDIRKRLRNWERHAFRIVAQCKIRWSGYLKDPAIADLLNTLLETSKEFADYWEQSNVADLKPVPKRSTIPPRAYSSSSRPSGNSATTRIYTSF